MSEAPSPESTEAARHRRAAKACQRCRKQKIRCSNTQPCAACARSNKHCIFIETKRYTNKYVEQLEKKLADSRHLDSDANRTLLLSPTASVGEHVDDDTLADSSEMVALEPVRTRSSSEAHQVINTLSMGQASYVEDAQGRPIYLGTSSNWHFGRRVLHLAHEHILGALPPPESLLWEGKAYEFDLAGDVDVLFPQVDYATYLLGAVRFRCGQLFHLFEEATIMDRLKQVLNGAGDTDVWRTHFYMLFAFGKGFVSSGSSTRHPPGFSFFQKGFVSTQMLLISTADHLDVLEILCCAALYLHSLDFRCAAYKVIGQALRTALEHGLHTDMDHPQLSEQRLERSRRIWWTVYLLDRRMTSQMGLPMAIRGEDMNAKLPLFPEFDVKRRALGINIKLSNVVTMVVNDIYGQKGRLSRQLLVNTKQALSCVARLTDELNGSFPMDLDATNSGISRVSASLHLSQHEVCDMMVIAQGQRMQSIILATRPFLLHFLERRLDHETRPPSGVEPSQRILRLLQLCCESALHVLRIVSVLQTQGLLETFLTADLDAIYNATIIVLLAAHIDVPVLSDHTPWTTIAYGLLQEIHQSGNRIAALMQAELKQLEELLSQLPQRQDFSEEHTSHDPALSRSEWFMGDVAMPELFDGAQLSGLADSISLESIDWLCDGIN